MILKNEIIYVTSNITWTEQVAFIDLQIYRYIRRRNSRIGSPELERVWVLGGWREKREGGK